MDGLRRRLSTMTDSRKWVTARLLPMVNRPLALGLAALVALSGVLPVAIIVGTGRVVGALPDALGQGLDSPPGRRALANLAPLGGCFIVLQVATTARAAAAQAIGWQLNRFLEQRVMATVASPAGIGHLEDPVSLDRIGAARDVALAGYRPCDAIPGMATRCTSLIQVVGAAAVLATWRWWLSALLLGSWFWRAKVARRWHSRGMTTIGISAPALRRGEYLRDLALTPPAAKELRVFGLTDWLVARYRVVSEAMLGKAQAERQSSRVMGLVSAWVTVVTTFAAYALVGLTSARGDLDLGGLALYATAIAGIQAVSMVGMDTLLLDFGTLPVPAVGALEAAIDAASTAGRLGEGVAPPAGTPCEEVRFESVTFRYQGAADYALRGLDLVLPAGRSVAIVGANGAGKTTLVKLLCRFYEPDGGRITVDGRSVTDFDPAAWQRQVAAVFQDFVRYPVSARDNILFGAVEGDADPEAAARRAGAFDALAALPHGIDTLLAPGHTDGTDLSGGQWQRVVLARALHAAASGARVLVLDEPTANLDARGEAELYDRFLDITRGVTTVVISHRFSTVRRADLIYVLEHGRVVEHGSHDELMARCGAYAAMFTVQAERLLGT